MDVPLERTPASESLTTGPPHEFNCLLFSIVFSQLSQRLWQIPFDLSLKKSPGRFSMHEQEPPCHSASTLCVVNEEKKFAQAREARSAPAQARSTFPNQAWALLCQL